ncbi:hypothetical protein A5677_17015 [Mycobacterium malmoense]|uniref:Uncharacterized protein n=1 Tax=Mycobacterium malmoense TaxID=1780 RepID=A0A1B9DA88_MYCMA|nr:hypothetical protein [Mycobacterium malmoense]OCB57664.1 hypothetical protein A5677_17015 [Mycobacterium malmoense]
MNARQLELSFDPTIADRFVEFHRSNPNVYATLLRLAREWVQQTGGKKIGIGALYERARWELAITTNDPDYRLNNDFRAFFARLIMYENPDLRGLFELRYSAADEWLASLGRTA